LGLPSTEPEVPGEKLYWVERFLPPRRWNPLATTVFPVTPSPVADGRRSRRWSTHKGPADQINALRCSGPNLPRLISRPVPRDTGSLKPRAAFNEIPPRPLPVGPACRFRFSWSRPPNTGNMEMLAGPTDRGSKKERLAQAMPSTQELWSASRLTPTPRAAAEPDRSGPTPERSTARNCVITVEKWFHQLRAPRPADTSRPCHETAIFRRAAQHPGCRRNPARAAQPQHIILHDVLIPPRPPARAETVRRCLAQRRHRWSGPASSRRMRTIRAVQLAVFSHDVRTPPV